MYPVRRPDVITRGPHKVFSPGLLHHKIKIEQHPPILRLPDITYPLVLGGVFQADLRGAVGGGVVRDDQFEIRESLPQERVQGLPDILLAIKDRHADTHPGLD